MSAVTRVRIIGPGRAGGSLGAALASVPGYAVDTLSRGDDVRLAAVGCDVLVIATPDAAIASVAELIEPSDDCVVMHLAGSHGLAALAPHPRTAALHPLVSLPNAELGASRLRGAWFAVAGDDVAERLALVLGGSSFPIDDDDRARYHATAAVAANHLVALLGQVERLAASANVPFEAFLHLAQGALDSVREVGPRSALTGPAARGDEATIVAHLEAIDPAERATYEALLAEARRLAS